MASEYEKLIEHCKAIGVVDANGKVRPLIGRLTITADGVIVGLGEPVYEPFDDEEAGLIVTQVEFLDGPEDAKTCYSTREAAERAISK